MVNGVPTSYVWSFNNKYIVAKIENATYLQIEDLRDFSSQPLVGNLTISQKEQLRSIPNAQVTTYTYDPLIGLTSITDPRGETTYYEYDDFNRLKHVKDSKGNILSKNEYNYKN